MNVTGTSTATSGQTTTPTAGTSALAGDFTTFLKMLTTQLQNQDPLNPIESSDYAVQLATFSGVEQQVRTNQLLEALAGQLGGTGIAQYAGWVGMEAQVTAAVAFTGAPVTLTPSPASDADSATLVVLDAQNREVARLDMPLTTGQMVWDGTDATGQVLPDGLYAFRVESQKAGELIGNDPVAAFGRIAEVRAGASGPVLVLEGGTAVPPSDVAALRPYGT